jgi:hypothetical protein
MNRLYAPIIILIGLFVMVGCGGGNQSGDTTGDPISPDPQQLTNEGTTDRDTSTTQPLIFEIGELIVDPEKGTITAVPIRGADFICNVLKFLQPPGGPSCITGLDDPHFDYDDDFVNVDMMCGLPIRSLIQDTGDLTFG